MIKRGKRVTALSLSVMLMLNMTATALPVSAAAGESKTYTHDGYTVEYTVMGEWAGNQNIQVTITNTSDEVLSNWAVGYNARGEINGLWNAQVYGHQGTEYILSGASYNCEIEPGQSTNFGYILTGDNFKIPQNIYNCAERVDITDGYNVYYNITGDYGDTYQAEMVIENLSDTDINAWQLSFDGNATIDNLWNGKLIENENGSFKVKNAEHNVVIGAGNSTSFNFSGTKLAEETGFDAVETSAPVTEPVVETTAVTDVSEEAFTDISETDIVISENETEAVSESETVTETEISVETEISAETEIVTETEVITETTTVFEQEIETNAEVVFDNFKLTGIVIPMEFDFEIDPEMDSDEDGLPDYIEKEIGSDRYNPDTDSDKLPDGYEYFMLGTDPIKEDSDDNTISDADEDFDEDKLSNLEEYNLGTDPFSKDSDYDNLSDYDEVNIHNTDPTEPDSDTDKVSDGDEIELGLDPNNPATNGYPDNEYTTEQTVGEDSEALDYINNIEDNPYTVSVEITAAGVAENNLSAGESGYSYSILQNDAVLGVVPELSYSDGLSVTDVVINFNIDASQTDTSIDNLMVFKFFEDTNMLLPIETTYNETTNTVSTHVDEVGTYCLIDVEKWLGILEETPAGNYYEGGENEPANIVFCLDTRSIIDDESFNAVKADIKAITENAFDRYSDIKVYVYYQQMGSNLRAIDTLLTDTNGNNYFESYEEVEVALDKFENKMIRANSRSYDFVEATQFMIDTCDEKIIAMYHITANDRVMGGINKAKKLTQIVQNSKYTTSEGKEIPRIYVSTLCPNDTEPFDTSSYTYELATLSGGIAVTGCMADEDTEVMTAEVESIEFLSNDNTNNTSGTITKSLKQILGEGNEGVYKIISSAGLTTIKLNQPLTDGSDEDYDKDGLSDWGEVNTTLIYNMYAKYNHSYPNVIKSSYLPKLADCKDYYTDINNQKAYVESGYEIFKQHMHDKLLEEGIAEEDIDAKIDETRILPINSNPADADSDNDGIIDTYDCNALKYCDNNDDIKDGYNNAFVTFKLDNPNKITFSETLVELKALPDTNSVNLREIENTDGNEYEVEYVTITSNSSWVRVNYDGIFGYINNSYVKVNENNETLLKLMFSNTSCIDEIKYDAYWLGDKGENIIVNANEKCVDTAVSHLEYGNIAFSQAQLAFLYVITSEIGDISGINDVNNSIRVSQGRDIINNGMFEWMLAASMHETKMGTDKDTWKISGATGYFQCTSDPQEDFEMYYNANDRISIKWSDLAKRLDKSSNINGVCDRNNYYGNIVIGCHTMRNSVKYSHANPNDDSNIEFREKTLQYYARGSFPPIVGYRASEFIYLIDEVVYIYENRWL